MDKIITMTSVKTKRGRTLGTEEASYKFMQLKLGGSYKGAVVTPQNEIHESWIDFIGKEFTVVYSGDKIT
jgi:hypothetical protein